MMDYTPDDENFDIDLDTVLEAEAERPASPAAPMVKKLTLKPLFQTLFEESVDKTDGVLRDFAAHVVGPLSHYFALKAAKGGDFFEEKKAAGAKNAERYGRDQTLRAHLINGMLPALHVARLLATWGARPLRGWDEESERLFIAGYMLHDFLKIPAAQETLKKAGFPTYKEMSSPSIGQIPTLERIFTEWGGNLGLDEFLKPIGGVASWAQDLIYIACNTQVFSGTMRNSAMLPNVRSDRQLLDKLADVSRLADLMAYVAPTPREMVANSAIDKLIRFDLGEGRDVPSVARLTYHHVAENRGLLLNLIHNAALDALKIDDVRVPLLYAPSGVVYLERHGAPAMPQPDTLAKTIVAGIRSKAGAKVAASGKGYEPSKDGYRVNETYRDLFDLREFIRMTPELVRKIRGNAPQYIEFLKESKWPYTEDMPDASTAKEDSRLRQMAEWASVVDIQIEVQFPAMTETFISEVLQVWEVSDLAPQFQILRQYNQRGTGVRHRWYWLALHALSRRPGCNPDQVLLWLETSAKQVISLFPDELPLSAQVNPQMWLDLNHYVESVLTVQNVKAWGNQPQNELHHYTQAKVKRGDALCAICGSAYPTREQLSSSVAFQPGVYTARISLAHRENKRNLCSICALEQLLRQLFMDNLDTGSTAEGQRIRYLSFYPSYFFTPETLRFMQRAYQRLEAVRVSEKELMAALRDEEDLSDAGFWQRLEQFLTTPSQGKFRPVLRYSADAQSTYLTLGFRSFDPKTETEAWILPTLMALVLSVCLDVKVVASDSGVPLMLESDELPETVWFDGAHPSVLAVMGGSRINIDHVGGALSRLAAAYMIHLDTEYQPPKENWNRFGPIAHSLMESPLYVFHYLKKQQRDDRPPSLGQVRRYIRFAETLFSSPNTKGEREMSLARTLVEQYRRFYRAKGLKNANSILRPLSVVADALLIADPRLFPDAESLTELAYGELAKFMDRVGKGQADGRFPKGVTIGERDAGMRQFSATFVNDLFIGIFNKDVAALRGKQLNLFRDTCEALYRDMQAAEWAANGKDAEEAAESDDDTDE